MNRGSGGRSGQGGDNSVVRANVPNTILAQGRGRDTGGAVAREVGAKHFSAQEGGFGSPFGAIVDEYGEGHLGFRGTGEPDEPSVKSLGFAGQGSGFPSELDVGQVSSSTFVEKIAVGSPIGERFGHHIPHGIGDLR